MQYLILRHDKLCEALLIIMKTNEVTEAPVETDLIFLSDDKHGGWSVGSNLCQFIRALLTEISKQDNIITRNNEKIH